MKKLVAVSAAVLTAAGLTLVSVPAADAAKAKAKAPSNCVSKAAEGTGSTEKDAKFQVDEALLQAVDWSAWASWMANGTTPGYDFGKRTYRCKTGSGLGFTCTGQAKICKKG